MGALEKFAHHVRTSALSSQHPCLAGKVLRCNCDADQSCHVDVIIPEFRRTHRFSSNQNVVCRSICWTQWCSDTYFEPFWSLAVCAIEEQTLPTGSSSVCSCSVSWRSAVRNSMCQFCSSWKTMVLSLHIIINDQLGTHHKTTIIVGESHVECQAGQFGWVA